MDIKCYNELIDLMFFSRAGEYHDRKMAVRTYGYLSGRRRGSRKWKSNYYKNSEGFVMKDARAGYVYCITDTWENGTVEYGSLVK